MKAEVALPPLLAAAQALKPYTTPQRWHTRTRLLYLHADGDTLTLSATTGEETATVPLPGAVCDGFTALAPDSLIKALTAIKPAGKAAQVATVTVHGEADRLHLSVGDGPAVGLDTDTPAGPLPTVAAQPAPHERPVTAGPVAEWCDLVAGVTTAAGREPTRPDLAVVRPLRDHPHVVLLAEATDRYRIHRGSWGDPHGDPVDVRTPCPAPTCSPRCAPRTSSPQPPGSRGCAWNRARLVSCTWCSAPTRVHPCTPHPWPSTSWPHRRPP